MHRSFLVTAPAKDLYFHYQQVLSSGSSHLQLQHPRCLGCFPDKRCFPDVWDVSEPEEEAKPLMSVVRSLRNIVGTRTEGRMGSLLTSGPSTRTFHRDRGRCSHSINKEKNEMQ